MSLNGGSLVETVLAKFPEKKKAPDQGDDIFSNWNFQDFQDSGYLNFRADRADLFALSIMVENYASKHNSPLLASFPAVPHVDGFSSGGSLSQLSDGLSSSTI